MSKFVLMIRGDEKHLQKNVIISKAPYQYESCGHSYQLNMRLQGMKEEDFNSD